MRPIILFFEDHRDPIAKEIVSESLSELQAQHINKIALEIDKDTSVKTHLTDLFRFCKLWSQMNAMPGADKERILSSVSVERRHEFQHHISNLSARKEEVKLILKAQQMNPPMQIQGVDLNLGDIRTLMPEQQLIAARALQTEREQAIVNNLAELNSRDGVIAILGLSHYEVAMQLKQKGHNVFCFLPVSIEQEEGVCSRFLKKIEQHDETVSDLILLDRRIHSMEEVIHTIISTLDSGLAAAPRMG